jgi:hypothetical protein
MSLFGRSVPILALAVVATFAPSCTMADEPVRPVPADVPEACDIVAPDRCGFPFPNDLWLVTESGQKKVIFGDSTLPTVRGKPMDARLFADHDGFSAGQSPMVLMKGATAKGMVGQRELEKSLDVQASKTLLMEYETGELVPHFAEIDVSTPKEDERVILLRPAVRPKDGTRYVVAIRGVVDDKDEELRPSPAFAALRDGGKTGNPRLDARVEARRAYYEDLFARLAKRGVDTKKLQVAWSYTTATRQNNTRDLLFMRDDALAKVGELGPEYRWTNEVADPNPFIAKRLTGMMKVPLYLTKPESGGTLVRGPDGLPQQNGWAEYEFVVHVPRTVSTSEPLPLLQNGHGLLGRKTEGQDGYLAEISERNHFVSFAVDWAGMASDDVELVAEAAATGPERFKLAVDRQHQGHINALLAMRMMKGRMKDDPHFQVDGVPFIDPTRCYYRGDSQGGIFGATYMAISTDVTRGLLGEPGYPYNLLLDRSVDFNGFKFLLRGILPHGADLQLALGVVQMLWDRTEPSSYAPYINRDPFPGTPSHEVLIHVAIGDHQVTPLGAHVLARGVGAKNVAPVNRTVFGIPEAPGPIQGSAMVEWDFGLPPAPDTNVPMTVGDDPHDSVRKLHEAMDQSAKFFREGVVTNFCDGKCDPQ